MPMLKDGERHDPTLGLSDVKVVGEGIAEFAERRYRDLDGSWKVVKDDDVVRGLYLNVTLSFHDETMFLEGDVDGSKWGEITLRHNSDDPLECVAAEAVARLLFSKGMK